MDRGTARTPFRRVGPRAAVLTGARTREVTSLIEVRRPAYAEDRGRPPPHPACARSCPQRAPRHPQPGGKGLPPRTSPAERSEHGRETSGRPPGVGGAEGGPDGGRAGIGRPAGSCWCYVLVIATLCAGAPAAARAGPTGAGSAGRNRRAGRPCTRHPDTPGRCGRSRRSRWRSGSRRTASARATAAWIWLRRRAPPCSPRHRAPWCSPELWRAAAWCRSSTRTACGPPTNRWPRASRGGRRSRREPCWARSSPVTGRAGRPACTGACGASGATTSTRSCCSCRGTCGCCRCPTRSQRDSSASRARSRATSRPCSWLTRDSVTPSIRPISARVRSSR